MTSRKSDFIRGRSYVPDLWERERVRKLIADMRAKLRSEGGDNTDTKRTCVQKNKEQDQ